jgi:hypothetical protein
MFEDCSRDIEHCPNSFVLSCNGSCHVKWVPCYHGMARPRDADGGDGLQIWRAAANILNIKCI